MGEVLSPQFDRIADVLDDFVGHGYSGRGGRPRTGRYRVPAGFLARRETARGIRGIPAGSRYMRSDPFSMTESIGQGSASCSAMYSITRPLSINAISMSLSGWIHSKFRRLTSGRGSPV
jgi:hypothetical protein